MTLPSRLAAYFTLFSYLFLHQSSSLALDLNIDLPQDAGKKPVVFFEHTTPNQKQPSLVAAPPVPEVVNNTVTENEKLAFPELSCLKSNIQFWEKVYSDVDVNQAILHNRNHLDIVYKVINLPSKQQKKQQVLLHEKNVLSQSLKRLAHKIDRHLQLTQDEKRLLNKFPSTERTSLLIIAASKDIRVQTGLKSQFEEGLKRSLTYMPTVMSVIEAENLPRDLAYLPHVESSYNLHAGSKAGAQGLWQLMPGTMKELAGSNAVQKRTDPKLSTLAAMKLLKQNYVKIGNWPLALTAYNYGANGILNAVNKTHSRDLCHIISKYNSPSFQFASSNFYAQFIAAKKTAARKYPSILSQQQVSRKTTQYVSMLRESETE